MIDTQEAERLCTKAGLSPQQRAVWMLMVVEDLELRETAERLGIAYRTAWEHYGKAREKLLLLRDQSDLVREWYEWLCHEAVPNLQPDNPQSPRFEVTGQVKGPDGVVLLGQPLPAHATKPVMPDDLQFPGRWRRWQEEIDAEIEANGRPGDPPRKKIGKKT